MAESQNVFTVFTYGSLMFPAVWERVVQGQYKSAEATIRGFRRLRVRGEQYPALIVDSDANALTGRAYFDVAGSDIARLDHFETSDYARVTIAIEIDGKSCAAQAYMSLRPDTLEAENWSPAEFERHGLAPFLATYAKANAPPA